MYKGRSIMYETLYREPYSKKVVQRKDAPKKSFRSTAPSVYGRQKPLSFIEQSKEAKTKPFLCGVIQRVPAEEENGGSLPANYSEKVENARKLLGTEWETRNLVDYIKDYDEMFDLWQSYGSIWMTDVLSAYNKLMRESEILLQLKCTSEQYEKTNDEHQELFLIINGYLKALSLENYLMSYRIFPSVSDEVNPFLQRLRQEKADWSKNSIWLQKMKRKMGAHKELKKLREETDTYEAEHNLIRTRLLSQSEQDIATRHNLGIAWTPIWDKMRTKATDSLKNILDIKIRNEELDVELSKSHEIAKNMIVSRKLRYKEANDRIREVGDIEHSFEASSLIDGILPRRGGCYGEDCGKIFKDKSSSVKVHNTLYLDEVTAFSVKNPSLDDNLLAESAQDQILRSGVKGFHITAEVHGVDHTDNPHAYRKYVVLTKWRTTEAIMSPLTEENFKGRMAQIRDEQVTDIEKKLRDKTIKKREEYRNKVKQRLLRS